MRLAWSEGSGVGGMGARGSCQGAAPREPRGGRAWLRRVGALVVGGPLRVPSGQASTGSGRTDATTSLRSCMRRHDACKRPFDRLRANGIGKRAHYGEWGSRRCDGAGGGGAPPLAPLDTGFRRYDDGDVRVGKCCWWRRGESPAAAGRALREAPLRRGVGESGMRRGLVVGVPRPASVPPFECLRTGFDFPQGERTPPHLCIHVCAGMARARGPSTGSGRTEFAWSAPTAGWGSRRCDGAGGGGAPRLAPLDTGFRRYDDGDVRANKCCWWRRGESPAAAGRALRGAPLRCVGGVGDATGVGGGDAPPLAPLDTGFRRYDDGDVRVGKCWWLWRGEGPAAAGRALRETPLRRCGGVGDADGVGGGDAPPLAPLDTGFRRYDDGDERVGKCWWLWRGEGPAAAGRALRETPLRRVGGVGDATGVGGGVACP